MCPSVEIECQKKLGQQNEAFEASCLLILQVYAQGQTIVAAAAAAISKILNH